MCSALAWIIQKFSGRLKFEGHLKVADIARGYGTYTDSQDLQFNVSDLHKRSIMEIHGHELTDRTLFNFRDRKEMLEPTVLWALFEVIVNNLYK